MLKKAILSLVTGSAIAAPVLAYGPDSGLKVGEMVMAFHPQHVAGPLKGTDGCPPCTYGMLPQVQAWINNDDPTNVAAIAKLLEKAAQTGKKADFKGFLIVLTDPAQVKTTAKSLAGLAKQAGAKDLHVAYLPKNDEAIQLYKMNTGSETKNTIFVYKNRKVTAKFVNLKADEKGLAALTGAIGEITK